ncbi:hypothetical protein FRX31_021022, partial [Thalictrum thalictroides]
MTSQLNSLGSLEEGETREVDENIPSTPKDSLDGPVGEVEKDNMQTDLLFKFLSSCLSDRGDLL